MPRIRRKRSSCNKVPNLDGYASPCGSLPLDRAFQNYSEQTGSGYFLDVGSSVPIRAGVAPVNGYSECCQPVFNTSAEGAGGVLESVNGKPVCGGGKRNNGRRATKKNKAKNSMAKYGKHTSKHVRAQQAKKGSPKNSKKNSRKNSGKKSKGKGKGKKGQKGGRAPVNFSSFSSDFNESMAGKDFSCTQPTWGAKCI